jgi:hypothetical protein
VNKSTAGILLDILEMKDTEAKHRAVAILLSAYVDKRGHFKTTPKNILADMLPVSAYRQDKRMAGLVSRLVKAGWLENRGAEAGMMGDWYLNIKRLGNKNTTLELEAYVAAAKLLERYPPQICGLIADEVQRRLRS